MGSRTAGSKSNDDSFTNYADSGRRIIQVHPHFVRSNGRQWGLQEALIMKMDNLSDRRDKLNTSAKSLHIREKMMLGYIRNIH